MIIRVDRTICAGHALCGTKVPELFELDEDGYCISDGREVPPELADRARLGASFCPEGAIAIVGESPAGDEARAAGPSIDFHLKDGSSRQVKAMAGLSVMRVAQENGIEGIIGECGGTCSCATCHVYVDAAFADRLPPVSADEADMLEGVVAERRPTSRLSCQIFATPELDGLVVHIPDAQS